MQTIRINASKSYEIHIGSGLLSRAGEICTWSGFSRRAFVVTDEKVCALHFQELETALKAYGFETHVYTFASGEASKTPETVLEIINAMSDENFTRDDFLIALGGGVTCDIAGLAAALYCRGIKCISIPTTLLAMVDASVGGKTGVNIGHYKNRCGVFSQPARVICDPELLSTLPEEQFAEGMAEIIKYGMIKNLSLLETLERSLPLYKLNPAVARTVRGFSPIVESLYRTYHTQLPDIIGRCIETKAVYVENDEFDNGERHLLNFGHTIGHAIEAASSYVIPHGFAVAMGMAAITRHAEALRICPKGTSKRLETLLCACGLPVDCSYSAEELYPLMLTDKKRNTSGTTIILPIAYGLCEARIVGDNELKDFLAQL